VKPAAAVANIDFLEENSFPRAVLSLGLPALYLFDLESSKTS